MEVCLLWGIRIGYFLLLLSFILPKRSRRTILGKSLYSARSVFYTGDRATRLMKFLDKITENPALRPLMLPETSTEYKKLEATIAYAGGVGGLTPNIVQLARYTLPPIMFIVMLTTYLFNTAFKVVQLRLSDFGGITDTAKSVFQSYIPSQKIVAVVAPSSRVELRHIALILAASLLFYYAPMMFLKWRIGIRNEKIRRELPIIETFIVIMLKSGNHTVYEILSSLTDTTSFFKPYIIMCKNEFFQNPKAAIQRMAERVGDPEFQIVCNGLKEAVDFNKGYTAEFINQHLDQLKKFQILKKQAMVKQKPLLLVCVLALPLFSVIVMWMYPWFVKALNMFSFNF